MSQKRKDMLNKPLNTKLPHNISLTNTNITNIKRIISYGNQNELNSLYKTMLIRDYRIHADIKELKQDIVSLENELINKDKNLDFINVYLKEIKLNNLIYDLSTALAYGLSLVNLVWGLKSINNKRYFVPIRFNFIDQTIIKKDNKGLFVEDKELKKHYIKNNQRLLLHKTSDNNLLKSLAFIFAIKQFVLGQYIQYLELLGVPPVIVNADVLNNQEIENIAEQILNLRSNSIGVFNKDTLVKLFEGKANTSLFLDFIAYLDSEISHLILGGGTKNTSSKNGSYSSEKVLEDKKDKIIKSHCFFLEDTMNELIKDIINMNVLNVSSYPKFRFIHKETINIKDLVSAYKELKEMGLELSKEQIRTKLALNKPLRETDSL